MRKMLFALAMLIAAMGATPALAQDSGALGWLIGKWCVGDAQHGKSCLTYTPQADGSIAAVWSAEPPDGSKPMKSEAVMRRVDGRWVVRSEDQDSDFREVSHGPNTLVLELTTRNVEDGSVTHLRYIRTGDDLAVEMVIKGQGNQTDRYRREK